MIGFFYSCRFSAPEFAFTSDSFALFSSRGFPAADSYRIGGFPGRKICRAVNRIVKRLVFDCVYPSPPFGSGESLMRKLFGLVSLSSLLIVCQLAAQEGKGAKDSEFYPLKKDSTWTYKVGSNSIIMKVTEVKADGAKLETIVNNKSVASEQILVKDDGIYRTAINGVKPDNPVKILELPPKKDATWNVETKIQGQLIKGKFTTSEEDITVPHGKYKATKVTGDNFEIAGMTTKVSYWFVPNVGIAKLSFELGGMKADLELEKYEAAAAPTEKK